MTAEPHGLILKAMTRRTFPLIFFGLLVVSIVAHSIALAAVWGILMAGYGISLLVHPRVRCLRCGGTGERRGWIFPWAFRRCSSCNSGRIIRRGAASAGLPHVRQQASQQRTARQNTSTRQRW